MSYLIAPRHYSAARLGEPPTAPQSQPQIPRDVRERYERELRNAINSNAVVQAIRRLPEGRVCPAPEHMPAHEQKIREKLRGSFDYSQLETGINLWRQSVGYPPRPSVAQQPPLQRQTGMRATEPGERERNALYTAGLLEQRFVLAEKTGDLEGMAKAAEEYHQLLGAFPSGGGQPMPGRGGMEKDRDKWLQVRQDVVRRAPNLTRVITAWELARFRGKIGEYVRQRMLVRQQRQQRGRR
jgi:hypothetical protein